ncbi:hypothetical protein TCON_2192 [Astathelohania contejeani]|uniref:Uncharacterized protein n=1 Tax=Astathelohania contejeani TaxID=164912 RepID=A0ABQ7HWN9_9MICR|nr:hypothetical protein TCON_2192 [Thelohania contejeani]
MDPSKISNDELKEQNHRLLGELSIVRQKLKKLEQINQTLLNEQKERYVNSLNQTAELKRELKMLKVQAQIKKNQQCSGVQMFKSNSQWLLEKLGIGETLLPFEYKRLKAMHDYFYTEFSKLFNSENLIIELKKKYNQLENFIDFVKFYILFYSVRSVFEEFIFLLLQEYGLYRDPDEYIEHILMWTPLDWFITHLENKEFKRVLKQVLRYKKNYFFYIRIGKERPFLLNMLLDDMELVNILKPNDRISKEMCDIICDNMIKNFINENTIEYIYKNKNSL